MMFFDKTSEKGSIIYYIYIMYMYNVCVYMYMYLYICTYVLYILLYLLQGSHALTSR